MYYSRLLTHNYFVMPIRNVLPENDGVIVEGQIFSGSINLGDELEQVGFLPSTILTVKEILINNVSVPFAEKNDFVKLVLLGGSFLTTLKGMTLGTPNKLDVHDSFKASVYLDNIENGGLGKRLENGYLAHLEFLDFSTVGTIIDIGPYDFLEPGKYMSVKIQIRNYIFIYKHMGFQLHDERCLNFGSGLIRTDRFL